MVTSDIGTICIDCAKKAVEMLEGKAKKAAE
jgi:hypothetical protein